MEQSYTEIGAGISQDFSISAMGNILIPGLPNVQHEEIFKKQNPVWKCEETALRKKKRT